VFLGIAHSRSPVPLNVRGHIIAAFGEKKL
jgi:hypothetical protein